MTAPLDLEAIDLETAQIMAIHEALSRLDFDARERVISYVVQRHISDRVAHYSSVHPRRQAHD
jgi:hypothetical protein